MSRLIAGRVPAAVILLALFVTWSSVAIAQEATTEEATEEIPKAWSNEGEIAYVNVSGNAAATTLGITDKFTYNFTYAELILFADVLRATSRTRELFNEGGGVRQVLTTTTAAERYEFGGKYRQNILDDLFWFGIADYYKNEPAGISHRMYGGGGVGYRFVENDNTKLSGEIGLNITNEAPVVGDSDTFLDARAFGEWAQKISSNADFSLSAEFMDNLQNTDQLRINTKAALTAQVTSVLALRLSWDMYFNNAPPSLLVDVNPDEPVAYFPLKTSDRTLGASLVFKF